jgi:hypothetical protein
MKEIIENLYVGNDFDCSTNGSDFAIIHACKTCHQKGIHYRGNLSSSHPNYLIYEKDNNLFLNLVDMDRELLSKFTHPIMKSAMNFIKNHVNTEKILVHCNQGRSRSPSIGLVYLAQNGTISSNSYINAKEEFVKIYPEYLPGKGFELYLHKNWECVMKL